MTVHLGICSYEITTEGDSFILAFHEVVDAAAFCLAAQESLLYQAWPAELLDQPESCTIVRESGVSGKSEVIYRGLRIRMGMHTGTPSSVMVSSSSRTVEYTGAHFATAKAVSDMGRGGQILLTAQTFHALYGKLSLVGELMKLNSTREMLEEQRAKLDPAELASQCVQQTSHGCDSKSRMFMSKRARIIANKGQSVPAPSGGVAKTASSDDLHDFPSYDSRPVNFAQDTSSNGAITQRSILVPPANNCSNGNADSWNDNSSSNERVSCLSLDSADVGTPSHRNEPSPVVVDMGTLKKQGNVDAEQNNLTDIMHAETTLPDECTRSTGLLSLYQLLSPMLVQRLSLLTSLNIPADMTQAKASFFDAPGVSSCTFADHSDFPEVTIGFCKLHQLNKLLADVSGEAASTLMGTYREIVLQALDSTGGYLCQDRTGLLFVSFMTPSAALSWAITVNLSLLQCQWPDEVLRHKHAGTVHDDKGNLLYKGPAPRISILSGRVHQVAPHKATGRAEYFGPVVNTCARMFAVCQPGQVLASAETMNKVKSYDKSLPGRLHLEQYSLAKISLKGVGEPVTIVDIVPQSLHGRVGRRAAIKSSEKAAVVDSTVRHEGTLSIVVPTAGILKPLVEPYTENV